MAATLTAMLQSQPGTSVDAAWPQVTKNGVAAQNLDLIQIVDNGGRILFKVNHSGVVSAGPSGTNGTRIGVFQSRLGTTATRAQVFADAFANPSRLDILHVVKPTGGLLVYYLDYLGVSH